MIGRKEGFWLSGFFNGFHSFPPQKILDFFILQLGGKRAFGFQAFSMAFTVFHHRKSLIFYLTIGRKEGFRLSGFFRPNKKHLY
jgi:hypothetical protein